MHELSIAEELLRIIDAEARKAEIRKVYRIDLRIGEFSGVVPDSLEFAFEVLSRGRVTEGARIVIEQVSPSFFCAECGRPMKSDETSCCECGCERIRMVGGDELEVVSFEGD